MAGTMERMRKTRCMFIFIRFLRFLPCTVATTVASFSAANPQEGLLFSQARMVPILLHACAAWKWRRQAQSEVCGALAAGQSISDPKRVLVCNCDSLFHFQPTPWEKQQHGEPVRERSISAHTWLWPDCPTAGPEPRTDPPTPIQHGRLCPSGSTLCNIHKLFLLCTCNSC